MTEAPPGKYSAMTVNERLFAAKLLDQFDSAINAHDREKALDILEMVEMPRELGAQTVDPIFANPKMYGYPRR